ncbi:hypothetical protein [Liquorilactobacillus satsumensis]|uniref:Uncharacterized protein n=1 Tax=Liquorilactobacillus satsumensis DSM 16230 = JCM 12392 TaxID=1423801 RepID=A0A0R1V2Y3_9LACO|nr:hypothetical protein [Liquorilactobacillus satsumensis]KRL99878.1 hypothetical protein FD50_GL002414 [Liquorilactobacillus satsumensis DSM 16230 = JCM 12392]MCC7665631.1 hypothetical protein [Liquorilactobacillus satsumensis]MCP9311843.1 hypothetical protein [Liquorilactobacillus satsumensis]MCP9328357.1 hypothetical protein [Liquorilactobacillus satsumensis]MCP9358016.1 hypothetical protein [Liquorilactobacillus satsumensis]
MALKKTTLQQIIESIQAKFNLSAQAENTHYQQMPAFQLKLFIEQAIQKHKPLSLCLTDLEGHEFVATGFISKNKNNDQIFTVADLYGGISHLIMFAQIKYVKIVNFS